MNVVYEVRTVRGTPVFSHSDEKRVREIKLQREKRIGTKMNLYKIVMQEELLDA